jgi:hypothetical protein
MVRDYCKECGYPDLSDRLLAFPYYTKKEELLTYLWNHPELVAVVGGPVTPHTGCMDATHALLITLCWCARHSQWPGRVAREMNITLGVADELNTETREAFTEKGVMLLLPRSRALHEALITHISDEMEKERGVFAKARVGQAAVNSFPAMLAAVRARDDSADDPNGKPRRLPDIDSETYYKQERSPKFVWQPPRPIYRPEEMERLNILDRLVQVGCRMEGWDEVAMPILEYVQQFVTLLGVSGLGKARVAIVGEWKNPATPVLASRLGWKMNAQAVVKLEHKGQEGRAGYANQSMHNSKTIRSAQILTEAAAILIKSKYMQHCYAAPIQMLNKGRAALGFLMKGKRVHIFEFCHHIPSLDLRRSEKVAAIGRRWTDEGLIDDNTRWLFRSLLHLMWYLNDRVGIAQLDNTPDNLVEVPWSKVYPSLNRTVSDRMPTPGWLCIVDWGGCFRIGDSKERRDNAPDGRASAVAPAGMMRMATQAPAKSAPAPPPSKL